MEILTTERRLTEEVHRVSRQVIEPGDEVIDATAGNGHDTLFLARQVGVKGHVYAIDLQSASIDSTRSLVARHGCARQVTLLQADHAQLYGLIPAEHRGRIKAVLFNLGYLPGGDRAIMTRSESTLSGLEAALSLLCEGGILSVLAYPGHPGGAEETFAVRDWMRERISEGHRVKEIRGRTVSARAPLLFVLRRAVCS